MKKLIGLAIFVGLIVFLFSSCPDKKDHTEALSDSVTQIIGEKVPGFDVNLINSISGMDDLMSFIGSELVDVDNYFLFSLGKIDDQVISFGICGHVFTFNDKIVKDLKDLF